MNLQRWILQRKPDWVKLEGLLDKINAYGLKGLTSNEILTLGSLYRSISADLSRARANNVGEQITDYLNSLTSRTHNYVYRLPPMKSKDIWDFFSYDFPETFRRCFPQFIIAFLIFWIGAAIAMISVHIDPANASYLFLSEHSIEKLQQGIVWTDTSDASPFISSFVITNNISIALKALAYGLFFGIGTIYIMFFNGFAIGGSIQVVIEHGLGYNILSFIAAHGVIELTTVYIAGGAGLLIGWALIDPGEHKRWDAVKLRIKCATKLGIGCTVLLIIAGTIEGLISPNWSIHPYFKFSIAIITAIGLILYFGFAGRNRPQIKS
ncbi:MAG: stage II sporulation protein M [Vampirovibrionia bacterium]